MFERTFLENRTEMKCILWQKRVNVRLVKGRLSFKIRISKEQIFTIVIIPSEDMNLIIQGTKERKNT